MNWIRENKFLTGFIAVMAIGLGILGYLLFTTYGHYSEVSDQYTAQASSLHNLQTMVPYPDEQNLAKYRGGLQQVRDATSSLAATLSQMVLPAEEMSSATFQDRLRATVSAIAAKAQKLGVKLPDHFYMGFDTYQNQPPHEEAATALGRQLAAMEIAMNMVLDSHVDSVTKLTRDPLPEESAAPANGAAGRQGGGNRNNGFQRGGGGGGGGNRAGGGRGESQLAVKHPFDIEFIAGQPNFRALLNSFATSSKQFFIVRSLVVENSNSKPVSKAAAEGTPAPGAPSAPPPPDNAAATPAPSSEGFLKFIVGTEKVQVHMRVNIALFNPPPAAPQHP